MSGVTEIYICKAGQELKDGKLVYSDEIRDKYQAEADAKQRCEHDTTVFKIGYYAVSESGTFRNFYTYENLDCTQAPGAAATRTAQANGSSRPAPSGGSAGAGQPRAAKKPGSLLSRVVEFFTEEVQA